MDGTYSIEASTIGPNAVGLVLVNEAGKRLELSIARSDLWRLCEDLALSGGYTICDGHCHELCGEP